MPWKKGLKKRKGLFDIGDHLLMDEIDLNYCYLTHLVAGEFVHEIRKSLSSLKILFQSIVAYLPEDDDSVNAYKIADKELDRLDELTKNFLSSLFNHQIEVEEDTEAIIEETIREILYLLQPILRKDGIKVKMDIDKSFTVVAIPDSKLKQVLLNLIINSKDAIADVDGPQITIIGEKTNSSYRLTIEDNGKGIKPDDEKFIFKPFYSTKGTMGLGLTISSQILEEYGGHLELHAQNRTGTRFIIELPRPDERK